MRPNLTTKKQINPYTPFFLIIGKSGAGKTTLSNILSSHLRPLDSYTTRPPRHEHESGHIFATAATFPPPNERVAYTVFNGYKYCATQEQVENSDTYVIDPKGVEMFLKKYKGERQIVCIMLKLNPARRFFRMLKRGDGLIGACSRLWHDHKAFKKIEVAIPENNTFIPVVCYQFKINKKNTVSALAIHILALYNKLKYIERKEGDHDEKI